MTEDQTQAGTGPFVAYDSGEAAISLEPLDGIAVTIVMENQSDLLLPHEGPARRYPLVGGPTRRDVVFDRPGPDVVRAEHGFSALVTIDRGDREHRVLYDTGITPDGMVGNLRRLGIDPGDIEAIVLSHGHLDHTGGLAGFVDAVGRAGLPVLLHPDFWLQRKVVLPHTELELPTTSRRALEDIGFELVERERPSFLLDRSLLVTGEVPRVTDFEKGFPVHHALRGGEWTPDPLILDDQALVAHLRGKGLVVVTGCGHAGIVNILRRAREITGVERIHAVIGGFHLTGGLFEPVIGPTVEALAALAPSVIFPGHCTGWVAQRALSESMPDAYIHPSVGTRLVFAA